MYLPLGVDTIKNTNKNVPTVYYQRPVRVEWTATTFSCSEHSCYFQQKCPSGYIIVGNIQGKNFSVVNYLYLIT